MVAINERKHLMEEIAHYLALRTPINETPIGQQEYTIDHSNITFSQIRRLGDISGLSEKLDFVKDLIEEEFTDPNKRVDGKVYSIGDELFVWDADPKYMRFFRISIRPEEQRLREIFFTEKNSNNESRPDHYPPTCKSRKAFTRDRYLCGNSDDCIYKQRVTIGEGNYGKDFFCCP